MPDLRLYRLAFAPALAALVILAFSLQGVPEPVEPPPGTLEFDAAAAAKATRDVLRLGDSRTPGSSVDNAAADLVRERFGTVVSGSVAEQQVNATIDGDDATLRNVVLTLPGNTDHAILIVAGRDTREGAGAPAGAAATGVLLELVNELSVTGRNHTVILASTSGASAQAEGAQALIQGLPDGTRVDAAVVISQPGFDEPFGPHLVLSAGEHSPPIGIARTAEEILKSRATLSPGRIGTLAQIARYAIPAASGEQAGLIAGGVATVALSSAGELPLPPEDSGSDRLSSGTLERFGPAVLGLVSALDSRPDPLEKGPGAFLWTGGNLVPGWSVALLVLALMIPPLALSASLLARARRNGERVRRAFGWSLEWWIPAAVLLAGLYLLALLGVIPGSGIPYDPARYSLGGGEAAVLVLLVALAAWTWWVLHLRRIAANPGPRTLGAASGLLAAAASVAAWTFNPYLALVLLPLVHVVAILGAGGRRPAALAAPAVIVAALPFVAALAYVASTLDWGASLPWQLAVLAGGGGLPVGEVASGTLLMTSVGAVVTAALATVRRGESDSPARSGVAPPSGG